MNEKKEPKYLDLSATCDINLTELFQQGPVKAKSVEDTKEIKTENKETETDKK